MQHTAWTEKKLRDSLIALRKKQQEESGQSAFSFQKKVESKKEEKNGETAEPLQRKEVKVDDGNAVVRADLVCTPISSLASFLRIVLEFRQKTLVLREK